MTDRNPKAFVLHQRNLLTLLLIIFVYNDPDIFFIEQAIPLYELGMHFTAIKKKSN